MCNLYIQLKQLIPRINQLIETIRRGGNVEWSRYFKLRNFPKVMKFWDSSKLLLAHPCLCSKWPCTVHFKMTALYYMRFASKKNKQDLWYLVTVWNSVADILQRLRESIGLLSDCILLSKCMILSEQRTSERNCIDSARLLFLNFFLSAHDCTVT